MHGMENVKFVPAVVIYRTLEFVTNYQNVFLESKTTTASCIRFFGTGFIRTSGKRETGTGQQVAQLHDRYMMMMMENGEETFFKKSTTNTTNRTVSSGLMFAIIGLPFSAVFPSSYCAMARNALLNRR